ncbi:MAG: hypothetical protein ABSC05_06155 [Candidatus Solibacter sp.]
MFWTAAVLVAAACAAPAQDAFALRDGDRVTGGGGGPMDVRIWRDVLPFNPTAITIMLGMNDGRYRAFDQAIFDDYATGFKHIVDSFKRQLPAARITTT